MENNKETIIEELDLPDLTYALSQLALKTIMNKEIETQIFEIKLSVPNEIIKVIESTSNSKGIPLEDLLSILASRGLDLSLQLDLNKTQSKIEEPLESVGLPPELENILKSSSISDNTNDKFKGLKEVLAQLGELGNLAKSLEGLQKTVQNVNETTIAENLK